MQLKWMFSKGTTEVVVVTEKIVVAQLDVVADMDIVAKIFDVTDMGVVAQLIGRL